MIFLVCGGRDFNDRHFIYSSLKKLKSKYPITLIVHGAARGADSIAGIWAKDNEIEVKAYPADWESSPKGAGPIRNKLMLDSHEIDGVVAFPGGRGTKDMIERAQKKGIKVWQPK